MNRHTIPLGRILKIPVGLDYSWFLIFALLTWSFAVSYYPKLLQGFPSATLWLLGAITAIMLFVSVLLHELGHSIVARRYNVPVKSITLFIFGGVAQITKEPPSAISEFWIAIAGPATSFMLAILFGLLQTVFTAIAPLFALAKYLAFINGTLVLFNLIPGFPLDGGRVFRAIVWGLTKNFRRATVIAANVGRFIAFLFIMLGVWQMFRGNFGNGLWIAFIGWFLESAATAQIQQQVVHVRLAGHKVSEAMNRSCTFIPADHTIQQLVEEHIFGAGRRCFIVRTGEKAVGLLTLHHIKKVPREQWDSTTGEKIMIPLDEMKSFQPNDELEAALQEMDRDGVNQLPVMTHGNIVGMLSREDVINYLRTLSELGV
ncbi:MAG: site-2 protease family protein [bacterium]|nr:MAG: site-2 protease family protein [bacterium]